MRKIRETLRLSFGCGLSQRDVAAAVGVGSSTVHDYLKRAKAAGLSWPLPEELDDAELNRRLFSREDQARGAGRPLPDWREVHREYARKGVTLKLLWTEYDENLADEQGYSYTRFCELYRAWAKKLSPTMRFHHKAGERLFVDYAGQRGSYIDAETGETREAAVFVGALGFSSLTYCEAQQSESLGDWIEGHTNAFAYFEGTPEIVVPDNTKSGVTHPCRYEPELNPTYHEMAKHYGVAVIPARVRRPRDKAKVEAAVQVVERWVLAPLRNELFVGLGALNEAIAERREALNRRPMRHVGKSRRELYESVEKAALRPLPGRTFTCGTWKKARVRIDYHVEYDGHFYSVPSELVHEEVEVRATVRTVEVYYGSRRVTSHRRSHVRGGHTTLTGHMPHGHRQYVEWTPERVIQQAEQIGPQTTELIRAVLGAREHPEQGFRSALGIVRLADRFGAQRLERAARRACHFGVLSYKRVRQILETGMDGVALEDEPETAPVRAHGNVRGSDYYDAGRSRC